MNDTERAQWELCLAFTKKLRAFFTEGELSDLREIE